MDQRGEALCFICTCPQRGFWSTLCERLLHALLERLAELRGCLLDTYRWRDRTLGLGCLLLVY